MALVEADGITEAAQSFLQLLSEHQFVTQQRVGVGEARVHLDGSREELNGDVVLPLQTETVPSYTPGLQDEEKKNEGRTTSFFFFFKTLIILLLIRRRYLWGVFVHVGEVFRERREGHVFL